MLSTGRMKRFKASILGGSGYGAGEIIRRLLIHPEVELVRVASIDYIGEPLSAAHPNLEGLSSLTFEKLSPEAAAMPVSRPEAIGLGVVRAALTERDTALKRALEKVATPPPK